MPSSIPERAPLLAPSALAFHNGLPDSQFGPADRIDSETKTSTRIKIGSAMFSFIILGLFTSSIGVMLPPLSTYYNLSDVHVSLIFLFVPFGYIIGASSNSLVHHHFGQRGIAVLGPALHMISAVALGLHPPFSILLAFFSVNALGSGMLDGSWCAFAAGMKNAGFVSGLLHGSFSVGAALGPFCAGALMEKGMNWWVWYYALAAASLVSLSVLLYAFRRADAAQYHSIHDQPSLSIDESSSKPFTRMLKYPALYLASLYFLTYCGIETAISGWIVSFTLRYLHASPYLASLSSSGFWIGMASGRLLLGHSTDRIGVRRAATIYLLLAIVLQAAFAFMRAPVEAVVLMTLLGVFMGPLFPSGVVVLTRLLPPDLHVRAVSFIVSLGQVGGAALPFGIGVFVESAGVGVFRWVILLFTILSLIVWIAFSRLRPAKTEGYATTPSEEDVTDD